MLPLLTTFWGTLRNEKNMMTTKKAPIHLGVAPVPGILLHRPGLILMT